MRGPVKSAFVKVEDNLSDEMLDCGAQLEFMSTSALE